MDGEDFDDLFAETTLLEDSSQESLTHAAANLCFCNNDPDCSLSQGCSEPTTSSRKTEDHTKVEETNARGDSMQKSMPTADNAAADGLQYSPSRTADPVDVIRKIQSMLEKVVDALDTENGELAIVLKMRPSRTPSMAEQICSSVPVAAANSRRLCFPGKSPEEAWRFTVVVRILELIHGALRNGVVLSKRDIYYRDPALFGSQSHVNRYIDDIAFTFDVPRSMLNITAAAKGLVAGKMSFCRRDGSIADAASDRQGMLVPPLGDLLSVEMSSVEWILVVEKEATFRSIAASNFWDTIATKGAIMTGKGYPDIASRALLHFLSMPSPHNGFASPAVFGLVDCDPDGLAILSIYKHGSLALSHENAGLRVPQVQWLGLKCEHMTLAGDDVHASQGLLSLTTRDRRKATKMIEQYNIAEPDEHDVQYRQALQTMLILNMKAELQLLDAAPHGMLDLLMSRLGDVQCS